MKKAYVLLSLLIFLTSCRYREEALILSGISEDIEETGIALEFKEQSFEGTLTKKGEEITLKLSSSNLPEDVEEILKGGDIIFSSGDFSLSKEAFSSPAFFIGEALKKLSQSEVYKIPGGFRLIKEPYEAIFSKDGSLKEILFPFGKLEISLSQQHRTA